MNSSNFISRAFCSISQQFSFSFFFNFFAFCRYSSSLLFLPICQFPDGFIGYQKHSVYLHLLVIIYAPFGSSGFRDSKRFLQLSWALVLVHDPCSQDRHLLHDRWTAPNSRVAPCSNRRPIPLVCWCDLPLTLPDVVHFIRFNQVLFFVWFNHCCSNFFLTFRLVHKGFWPSEFDFGLHFAKFCFYT